MASANNILDCFNRLCGGCNAFATKQTIKTAYQSEIVDTKNCPRHCDVWSLHSKGSSRKNSNSFRQPATNCMLLLLLLLNLAAMLTSTLAAPTTTTTTTTATTSAAAQQAKLLLVTTNRNGSGAAAVAMAANSRQQSERYALPHVGVFTARLRKRHSKRHSDWYHYNENSTEWNNPCGGDYNATNELPVRRISLKQMTKHLKETVSIEHKQILSDPQHINITNLQMWFLHDYQYKFLPKLKPNSTVALKRWHRNLQTYVGTFVYLLHVQTDWDRSKMQRESRISQELKNLLYSSMRMTCELETAVNNTRPHTKRQLAHISATKMNNRLKLRTKRRRDRNVDKLLEADPIDLKFVKHYYYEFLHTMLRVLRRSSKRKGQLALKDNRQEFNEVEKNFGSIAALSKDEAASAQLRASATHKAHSFSASGKTGSSSSSRSRSRRRHDSAHRGRNRTAQRASDTPA